jgi:hypothetical protein
MKKIFRVLIFCFTYVLLFTNTNSEFTICDSGNINLSANNVSDICNEWFENNSIDSIKSLTWKYIDMDLWFWWLNNIYNKRDNISDNLITWFFNDFISTKVLDKEGDFYLKTWFFWTNNLYNINSNILENLAMWFFDNYRNTIISNTNPSYDFPIWFLWNHVLENTQKKSWTTKKYISYTYRNYFVFVFKIYSDLNFSNSWYSYREYDKFINSLVNLYLEWYNNSDNIISDTYIASIDYYIENNQEFQIQLWILMNNLDEINNWFSNLKTVKEKKYMIDYYLNL